MKKRIPVSVFALLCAQGAWAQPAVPDAGSVLRDLQQAPVAPAPAPALRSPGTQASPPADDGTRIAVKSVRITGNEEIPERELRPFVDGLAGGEHTLAQIDAAARRITAYYRARGFAVARAYVPAQDVTDGVLTIGVIEGRVSGYSVRNQSRLDDDRVRAYLGGVRPGDVVRSDRIDRGLLLLQDTPGVGGSRATLQPGAATGTSELLVEVDPARPYTATASADNHGSRYTGEYRVSGSLSVASPSGIGDQFTVGALTSGKGLSFLRLAYQLPVGAQGWRVGAAVSATRYRLAREFEALDAHGDARSTSVFATYPFVRTQAASLGGVVSLESRRLEDEVDATATSTQRRLDVASVGLAGSLKDEAGGGGISAFDVTLVSGRLSIDSPAARLIDSLSARTEGGFTRLAYGASRLQRLTDASMLWLSFTGQQAGKNLDSSEKFSLGGANAVRAYPQGEASGDEGLRGTLELRHMLGTNVQGTLFYDWGKVRFNQEPFGAPAANSRSLAGVGVGLNADFRNGLQVRGALAWRTHGGDPTSIPASEARRPVLWLQAGTSF